MPIVLGVEDDPYKLRTAMAMLEDRHQVFAARHAGKGREQACRYRPGFILMDFVMPTLNGIQALVALREDDALQEIPVIAVTLSTMTGDRASILAHGFNGYLPKPVEHELMMKRLRNWLDE